MDKTDYKILEIMQSNGRISMKDLGISVGLTAPAVSERVKKMEEIGIITGYAATLNYEKLGKNISAFVNLNMPPDKYNNFLKFASNESAIVECHHITGGDSLTVKVLVDNIASLEIIIDKIKQFAKTNTSIILSSPILKQKIDIDIK